MQFTYLDQDTKSKDDESNWYHHCSASNMPYITTRKRTTFGDVEWDFITVDQPNDNFSHTEEKFIVSELRDLLKYYAVKETMDNMGGFYGIIKNIPVEHVNDVALDVCNTLEEALRRSKKASLLN